MRENLTCSACEKNRFFRFNRFCDDYRITKLSAIMELDITLEQKLLLTHDMISLSNRKLWIKFVRQEKKEIGCELEVNRVGLACTLTVKCTHHKTHSWSATPNRIPNKHPQHSKSYDINCLSILAAHRSGLGWSCMTDFFALLGIRYMGQHAYEDTEKHVGKKWLRFETRRSKK